MYIKLHSIYCLRYAGKELSSRLSICAVLIIGLLGVVLGVPFLFDVSGHTECLRHTKCGIRLYRLLLPFHLLRSMKILKINKSKVHTLYKTDQMERY